MPTITIGNLELSEDEARKAGLLLEQRASRAARQRQTLRRLGADRSGDGARLAAALDRLADDAYEPQEGD